MRIANAAEKERQNRIDTGRGSVVPAGRNTAGLPAGAVNPKDSDSVTISDEGKERLEAQQEEKRASAQENKLLEMLEEQRRRYEEQREASDKSAKTAQDFAKVMEIARRIANGDKVPGIDEKKLMEYNSDLYQAAKAAAIVSANKEKHKEYDSLFKDEKKQDDKRGMLRALERDSEGMSPDSLFADSQAAAEGGGSAASLV